MKKIISCLLTLALVVGFFSSMNITASADYSLTLGNDVTVEGNEEGRFSQWVAFTPEETGRYSFQVGFDEMLYWGYIEGILCDSTKTMMEYTVNHSANQICYVEADLVAGENYYLQVLGEEIGEAIVSVEKILKVTGLEIESYPDRDYFYDTSMNMDLTGLVIKGTLEDGSTETWSPDNYWSEEGPGGNFITMENDMNPDTGYWSEFSVTCGGHTVEISFTYRETPIESVTVNSAPSRVYYWGDICFGLLSTEGYYFDPMDLTGLSFTVKFKDGTSKTYTDADIDAWNMQIDGEDYRCGVNYEDVVVGQIPVYFSYMGYQFTYNVTMEETPISELKVIKDPNVTILGDGFQPDFTGMTVELTYKNDQKKTITADENTLTYGYTEAYLYDPSLETMVCIEFMEGAEAITISYAGTSIEYHGFQVSDSLWIEDIELSNVSLNPVNLGIKITDTEGNPEELDITRIEIVDSYEHPERNLGYTWCKIYTNKGVIDCDIWANYVDGKLESYEVAMLGREFMVEAAALPGDVNEDGNVNASDALLVLKHAARIETLDKEAATRADVTKDQDINASDALDILKYAARIIDSFE